MRRPLALATNGLFRSRASSATGRPSSSRTSRVQQLLLCLLCLSVGTVVYIGHSSGHIPGLQAIHVPHGSLMPHHAAPGAAGSAAAKQPQALRTFAGNLDFPLWWHAPFIAQSGLGTEAMSIIEALISTKQIAAEDIYITHSGDTFDHAVLKALSPATRNLLARRQHPQQVADEWIEELFPTQKQVQLQRLADMKDTRKAIAVCHNWFDCWRKPGEVPSNIPGCPCPLGLDKTAYSIARTMFETAGLPAHLADHVKAMDEVWVPTQFNKDSFAAAGVDPAKIRIVPEGIDTTVWDPALHRPINVSKLDLRQATGPPSGPVARLKGSNGGPALNASSSAAAAARPYIFLSVFKWEARKGWKDLVRGFCDAFKPSDNVVLWILTKPFLESGEDFEEKVRAYAAQHYKLNPQQLESRLPRIYTSKQQLSESDFISVYKLADALVIPTHGEGWGRPQIEAMAMSLPVITTNWSGPTAFLSQQVAYPLAIEGLSVVKSDGDPNFFKAFIGQKWAQPSVTHLVQLMQHVFRHPAEAAAKGKAARRHIERHFTPQVVAREVAEEVRRLQPILRQRQKQQQRLEQQQRRAAEHLAGKKGVLSKMGGKGGTRSART